MWTIQHFRRRGQSGDNLVVSLLESTFRHLARAAYIVQADTFQDRDEPRRRWSAKTWSCDGPATDALAPPPLPPPPPASGWRPLPSVFAARIYGIS